MPAKKVSPDLNVAERLGRLIESSGPISVAHYMAEANAHYYGTRDPLGAAGDFTTAPEISQMFGELVGLWLADIWHRAGAPTDAVYVELGPGRGTLAADALRAMRSAGLRPDVHFVETSPVLRAAQRERVAHARWHDDFSTVPDDRPLLVVANEFFDALPVRQLIKSETGWRELLVDHRDGRFIRVQGPLVPVAAEAEPNTILETSPASAAIVRDISQRVGEQGGEAIIFDYGHLRSGTGDTLQAMRGHEYSDPWKEPGEQDLTAHVDFSALYQAAGHGRVRLCSGTQGQWLERMGIGVRAAALAQAAPERADEMNSARQRLTAPDQMGELFKVMAIVSQAWPDPAGFQ